LTSEFRCIILHHVREAYSVNDDSLAILGERLRRLRTDLGLSQKRLCEEAGVSKRFLIQLEAGESNVSIIRLSDVARALDCSLVTLLRGLSAKRDLLDNVAVAVHEMPTAQQAEFKKRFNPKSKVALIGLRGAGKSTVGRGVSERIGCEFIELARLVESREGMSVAEMFEYHGAEWFAKASLEALRSVVREDGEAVIEVGGSMVLDAAAWDEISNNCRSVWLMASPERHIERVLAQGDTRPMAGRADPLGELRRILTERTPIYERAHLHIDTESLGVEGSISAVVDVMSRSGM
jgi:XRE family aerobic/anaerobic benzoate catabolism transcriptional regulator